jgi:adenylate cyclase
MTLHVAIRNMHPNNSDNATASIPPEASETSLDLEALSPRQMRVVLVCDVVESVRWMEHDEDNAITRWSQFATQVRSQIAPAHGGSVVKSTGDGLMMEFMAAPGAVAAANAMQKIASEGNINQEPERQMHLRIGIHQAQVRRDAHDLYGHGVNLAARITTLAGPDEIIVTPEVRDHLTDSLDGEIEDMGECYLKHLSQPQRVYRVSGATHHSSGETQLPRSEELKPVIAVIPFANRCNDDDLWAIGELIADGVIAQLSRSSEVKVLSRLSTSVLRERTESLIDLGKVLKATHVLSGYYARISNSLMLVYELSQMSDALVIGGGQLKSSVEDLLSDSGESVKFIAASVSVKLMQTQANAVSTKPLANLRGYSILLGGIQGMHNSSSAGFGKTRNLFEYLIDRYPRSSDSRAWFAKWHVLSAVRNFGQDKKILAASAMMHTQKALDSSPDNSLAICMQGFVYLHLLEDLESAKKSLDAALILNPSEAFAWLVSSVLSSISDDPGLAVEQSQKAIELSPIDPLRYYFLSLRASALLSADHVQSAIDIAQQSLRLNSQHSPTLRVLLTAQVEQGRVEDARVTLSKLTALQPGLTLAGYMNAGAASTTRLKCARALKEAGLH